MWFERFVIIGTSLHRDYLPSAWTMFYPSHIDIGIFVGTIGLFFVFFLLFARYFPVLPIAELKTIVKSSSEYYKNLPDSHSHGNDSALGHSDPNADNTNNH
jgi:molybdopterin-containing oxidoreductase family membrane subunit